MKSTIRPSYLFQHFFFLPCSKFNKVSWTGFNCYHYFQILTDLSWLADAIIPVECDCAKAAITPSCAGTDMVWFSITFHNSSDCINWKRNKQAMEPIYKPFVLSIKRNHVNCIHLPNTEIRFLNIWNLRKHMVEVCNRRWHFVDGEQRFLLSFLTIPIFIEAKYTCWINKLESKQDEV